MNKTCALPEVSTVKHRSNGTVQLGNGRRRRIKAIRVFRRGPVDGWDSYAVHLTMQSDGGPNVDIWLPGDEIVALVKHLQRMEPSA